ncbi:endonuclease/exonuclease/phosphatase family protein [Actinoplanes missouriensis]|uniref:endonuclease/exonuclease/phosphatase family protein n=1 Tax=Actinoplanes missouriensis TaxID=1866 RepID=UPI001E57A10B|nr:endonuclease/exonuclease/phosphatase family protein [Actinoplanes missouriensis]
MPIIVAALLLFHRAVPNASLLETFLPWLGVAIPILLVRAWFRSLRAVIIAVLPLMVWLGVFGERLLPASGGTHQLVAVQHNVSDENPDPAGTARTLVEPRPDFVGLEEVTPEALPAYTAAFGRDYPHVIVQGTVALWSRHPLTEARLLDIRPSTQGPDWNRALRAVAHTPHGDIAVYVAHLSSVRLGLGGFDSANRDESARKLAAAVATEPLDRVLLLGDLNSTVDDRVLDPVLERVHTAGGGFAFSWPVRMPVARIDHVMADGMAVVDVRTLPRTGSDHLPVVARLRL